MIGAESVALGIGILQTESRLVARKGLAFAICPDGLVDCRDNSRVSGSSRDTLSLEIF